jgi:hypothetical protein
VRIVSIDAKKIKIKSWATKAAFLKSTLSDHQALFTIYELDFMGVLRIADGNIRVKKTSGVVEANIKETQTPKTLEEIEDETKPTPGESNPTRTLFRKIAFATHPDRQGKDPVIAQKNEEIFKRAMSANSESDISELIMIGHDLDIDLLSLGYTMPVLKKIYKDLEEKIIKQIKKIEGCYGWAWGESKGNLERRINILDGYLRQTGHPGVDRSILSDIVEHHEADVDKTVRPGRTRKPGQRPKKLIR